jgi:hypothetical protein
MFIEGTSVETTMISGTSAMFETRYINYTLWFHQTWLGKIPI